MIKTISTVRVYYRFSLNIAVYISTPDIQMCGLQIVIKRRKIVLESAVPVVRTLSIVPTFEVISKTI